MDTNSSNKIIGSLCYFSIFFAGFIFPLAVYFIVDREEVKQHAKSAFVSHIIPFITIPPAIFLVVVSFDPSFLVFILVVLFIGGINLAVVIWNVVKGIKLLRNA